MRDRSLRKFLIYSRIGFIFSELYTYLVTLGVVKVSQRLEFVVFDEARMVIVLNPKVGSRSIVALAECYVGGRIVEGRLTDVHRQFPSGRFSWIVMLRDPVSRVKSAYKQKVEMADSVIKARIWSHYTPAFENIHSPQDFVDFLCSKSGCDDMADRHWKSQSLLLGFSNSSITYAKTFIFPDFSGLKAYLDYNLGQRDLEVPHILKGESASVVFDEHTAEKIKLRYAADYELMYDLKFQSKEFI